MSCPVCLQQQQPLQPERSRFLDNHAKKKQLFNSPHIHTHASYYPPTPSSHSSAVKWKITLHLHRYHEHHLSLLCAVESSLLSSSPSEFSTRTTMSMFGAYLRLRRIPCYLLACLVPERASGSDFCWYLLVKNNCGNCSSHRNFCPGGLFSKARKQSHHFSSVLSRVWVLCGSVGLGKNWTEIRHILRWNAGKTVKCDCWFGSTTTLSPWVMDGNWSMNCDANGL